MPRPLIFSWLIKLFLILSATTAHSSETAAFLADLKGTLSSLSTNSEDNGIDPTAIPQIACLLDQTMGSRYRQSLSDRLNRESPGDLLKSLDDNGEIFISGWIPHAADSEQAGLWMSGKGGFVAVIQSNGNELRIFSNDPELARNPPDEIRKLLAKIAAHVPYREDEKALQNPEPTLIPSRFDFPEACRTEEFRKTAATWTEAHSGRVCNEFAAFSSDKLTLARPLRQGKAYLFNEPIACGTGPCPQRRKAYLVAGDYVDIAQDREGFSCVRYNGKSGQTFGWLSNADIKSVDIINEKPDFDDLEAVVKIENTAWMQAMSKLTGSLTNGLPSLNDWEGKWIKAEGAPFSGKMSIKSKNKSLNIVVDATAGYNIGGINAPLRTNGRVAHAVDDGMICAVFLIRLNNAIYILDNGNCGGHGVSLDGPYMKN